MLNCEVKRNKGIKVNDKHLKVGGLMCVCVADECVDGGCVWLTGVCGWRVCVCVAGGCVCGWQVCVASGCEAGGWVWQVCMCVAGGCLWLV